jgi:hypothetical protein
MLPENLHYTVDSPHIENYPDQGKSVAFEYLSYIRAGCNGCGSASVAAKPPHFEDLSGLKVSDLRAGNCSRNKVSHDSAKPKQWYWYQIYVFLLSLSSESLNADGEEFSTTL